MDEQSSMIKDIRILLIHAMMDLDYGAQGSYGDGDTVDKKAVEQSKRAIKFNADMYHLKI